MISSGPLLRANIAICSSPGEAPGGESDAGSDASVRHDAPESAEKATRAVAGAPTSPPATYSELLSAEVNDIKPVWAISGTHPALAHVAPPSVLRASG